MTKTLYNLGSGARALLSQFADTPVFEGWQEIRVDVNAQLNPDIAVDLNDLDGAIDADVADLVFCSHVIEHFHDHEIDGFLAQILRLLKPGGAAIFKTPDLAQVMRLLDEEDLEKTLYTAPAGDIAVLDVLFGHRKSIAAGNRYMAHHTGFTETSLARRLLDAGFEEVATQKGASVDFTAVATTGVCEYRAQIELLL